MLKYRYKIKNKGAINVAKIQEMTLEELEDINGGTLKFKSVKKIDRNTLQVVVTSDPVVKNRGEVVNGANWIFESGIAVKSLISGGLHDELLINAVQLLELHALQMLQKTNQGDTINFSARINLSDGIPTFF